MSEVATKKDEIITETVKTEAPPSETPKQDKPQISLEDLQAQLTKAQAEFEASQKHIKELNAESAARRKKLEEYEKQQEEANRAKMTETEKAMADAQKWQTQNAAQEKKYAELEERFNEFRINLALEREATKLGFLNPADAVALVDLTTLTIGDDGKVSGFEKMLKELAESGRLPMREAQAGTPQPGKKPQQKTDKPDTTVQTLMRKHRM